MESVFDGASGQQGGLQGLLLDDDIDHPAFDDDDLFDFLITDRDADLLVGQRGLFNGIIETLDVEVLRFSEVSPQFVADYGEGDRTMTFWQDVMWHYYAEECGRLGIAASRDMPLVCEYFRLVYPHRTGVEH